MISVLARRLHEQGRVEQLEMVLDRLESMAPARRITWISSETERLYPSILALVREYNGRLNFHDALIAIVCQEYGIQYVASFDRDFDDIRWVHRIASPDDVPDE